MVTDAVEVAERRKYEQMWTHSAYRRYSPGSEAVNWFLDNVFYNSGDTILDAGCGTGRAGLALHAAGLRTYLLDFASNSRDPEALNLPFIEACLWNLPKWMLFDWIYCADVMEHIPETHVDAVLDGLARATWKGGMFQIALGPDGCGQLIGETLHLTVKPVEWWHAKIAKRWDIVKTSDDTSQYQVIVGAPKYASLRD